MNKFVGFLEKLGKVLAAGVPIAEELFPAVAPFLNLALPASAQPKAQAVEATVSSELALMAQSVTQVETIVNVAGMPTLSGAQKAAAAAPAILQVLENSVMMTGKKIANPAAASTAAATIAGGLADYLNALDGSALPNPPSAS